MIIRSQDKRRIINFNQITNIATMFNSRLEQWEIYVCYAYCNDAECGNSTIAYYSTEEKAVKVLDMIEDACRNVAFTDGVVFRMPEDEDVEV